MSSNKKDDFDFAAYVEQLKSAKTNDDRKPERTQPREYFLIVCEGERTEPNYFNAFKERLPKDMLDTIDIRGEGNNTIGVVEKAIEYRDERNTSPYLPAYTYVWAVFDRDSFPKKRVNQACITATENGILLGFSNEAFELWYVLHFQYLDVAISRHQYIDILNKIFLEKTNEKYEKNHADVYSILEKYGNQDFAIHNAKTLCTNCEGINPADAQPSTTVYELVEQLNEYIGED